MTKPVCCELGSALYEFKSFSDKGFLLMDTLVLLTLNRTPAGTCSGPLIP